MTRTAFILSIGLLSFGAAACGGYDEKNAAYDQNNAAAYDEGNAAYDEADNAAYAPPEGNAGYTPPADGNVRDNNMVGDAPSDEPPPANSY